MAYLELHFNQPILKSQLVNKKVQFEKKIYNQFPTATSRDGLYA